MKKEDINAFTLRISQGNKSDIIVVVYDIYFAYEKDARDAIEARDIDGMIAAIRHCTDAVSHLMNALDFSYEISLQLYPLYDFVRRSLAKTIYSLDTCHIDIASNIMKSLREAFIEVAKSDDSGRSMKNAETISAGYTYGRGSLNEFSDGGSNRGFYA